ncbi:hypothetical protein F66182_10424, partial [Fusarium sp. NRRL 66182]
MSHQSILRITRELSDLQKGNDLSLAVTYDDSDIRNIKALVVGPPGTPYEFGFFELSVKFPEGNYPASPPKVTALTTNSGRCRFAPNIYASGKVCLSILGTWQGERGEEWSSAQGLESVLISIQSLMSSNPYENEPGYEAATDDPKTQRDMADYIAKIKHETIRLAVLQPLEESLRIAAGSKTETSEGDFAVEDNEEGRESYQSFDDLRKRRFLWYFDSYMHTIDVESGKVEKGQLFQ